ncbi:MAG: hypothetical protein JNL88_10750 [Bacteroidia bacterium]|nr:hypothetical protein [Bacteroidia bacterium]
MLLRNFILLVFCCSCFYSEAQELKNETQLFRYACKLQEEDQWNDALIIFKNLLKSDSSDAEYLWRTSFIYSKLGVLQSNEPSRQQWYTTAAYLGKKAVTQHPQHANAHYAFAVALGRMNEHAGNKTKIQNARLIKSEAETAIQLDPKLPGPYHLLGRWHRVIAGFNAFEKTMIKAMFGAMPGGSYDDAIRNFEKAILLEPLNGIHYYELAVSFTERNKPNDKQQAKNWLGKALQIPVKSADDAENRKKCEDLLAKLK